MAEKLTPPRPIRPTGEIVGPEGAQEDVSSLTERAIMVRAYDVVLRVSETVRMIRAGFSLELDALKERIGALEAAKAGSTIPLASPPPAANDDDDDDTFRAKEPSIHEWDQLLEGAGHELTKRVKDPNSKFDSARARAIAAEVAVQVVKKIGENAELSTWRRLKGLLPMIGKETLRAVIPLIIGGFVVELLHLLGKLR